MQPSKFSQEIQVSIEDLRAQRKNLTEGVAKISTLWQDVRKNISDYSLSTASKEMPVVLTNKEEKKKINILLVKWKKKNSKNLHPMLHLNL